MRQARVVVPVGEPVNAKVIVSFRPAQRRLSTLEVSPDPSVVMSTRIWAPGWYRVPSVVSASEPSGSTWSVFVTLAVIVIVFSVVGAIRLPSAIIDPPALRTVATSPEVATEKKSSSSSRLV